MTIVVHNERVRMCANSLRALSAAPEAHAGRLGGHASRRATTGGGSAPRGTACSGADAPGSWRVTPPADADATVLMRGAPTEPAGKRAGQRLAADAGVALPVRSDWRRCWPWTTAPGGLREPSSSAKVTPSTEGIEPRYTSRRRADFGPADERRSARRSRRRTTRWCGSGAGRAGRGRRLAVTSDVDAMTLLDFLRRPLEV